MKITKKTPNIILECLDVLEKEKSLSFGSVISYKMMQRGSASLNYLVQCQNGSLFIKKPKHRPSIRICRNLQLAQAAKIKAPQLLSDVHQKVIVLDVKKGHSLSSTQISSTTLKQLWQEYQKFHQIKRQSHFILPSLDFVNLRDDCMTKINQIAASQSFLKRAILRHIAHTLKKLPTKDLTHQLKYLQVIHGDFHNNNILFYKGNLSAILDWEECRLGYACEDWLRFTFCAVERILTYPKRRRKIRLILSFLLAQKTFSSHEWRLGFNSFLLLKMRRFVAHKPTIINLIKTYFFILFWQDCKNNILQKRL